MFYLIGIGLAEKDLSVRALEILRECEKVYVEFYTNTAQNLSWLEAEIGQEIVELTREEVEQEEVFLESANERDVALLISGDSLAGTTHLDLVERARDRDIEAEIIHAPSIFTAVAETGLSLYRFGRVVTLPAPQEGYLPTSPYEQVARNLDADLHTLLLLDIDLSASEALRILEEIEQEEADGVFTAERELLVLERLGQDTQSITYGTLEALKERSYGDLPHALVLPASLTENEQSFLDRRA